MANLRYQKTAKEGLIYAAFQCWESGLSMAQALQIVAAQYDKNENAKKGGE